MEQECLAFENPTAMKIRCVLHDDAVAEVNWNSLTPHHRAQTLTAGPLYFHTCPACPGPKFFMFLFIFSSIHDPLFIFCLKTE